MRGQVVTILAVVAFLEAAIFLFGTCRGERLGAPSGRGETVEVCRRPMLFAMPGQGGDAPGWIALRDAAGWVRGIVRVGMASSAAEFDASWEGDVVRVPLHAEMSRLGWVPGPLGVLADRAWRWRAALGLVRSDEEFR